MRANQIRDLIDHFLQAWPNAEFGAAHPVLSDLNLEDEILAWTKGQLERQLAQTSENDQEVEATLSLIHELLGMPEAQRCADLDESTIDELPDSSLT